MGNILVSVDDGDKVDLVGLDSLLQDRQNPTRVSTSKCSRGTPPMPGKAVGNSLRRVRRVNDNSLLRLVVHHQIGVVVPRPPPCFCQFPSASHSGDTYTWECS